MKTTGNEKASVCTLSPKRWWNKVEPYIVFRYHKRQAKKLNEEFGAKCVIQSSSNGWMNDDLTLHWVQSVIGKSAFSRRLLMSDSFRCHLGENVKKELLAGQADQLMVPMVALNAYKPQMFAETIHLKRP